MADFDCLTLLIEVGQIDGRRLPSSAPAQGPLHAGAGRDDDRQLAWAQALTASLAEGTDGDLIKPGRCLDSFCHEGPLALMADHQPLLLQVRIDRPDRVDVYPRAIGQSAEARQALDGGKTARSDQRPQLPGELNPDRDLVPAVGRERICLIEARYLLCH